MKIQLFLFLLLSFTLSTVIELKKHKSTENVVTSHGRMNISNYQIYQYSGNFTIGTPAQNTTIVTDINSNQFWIPYNNLQCYSSSTSTTANITSTGGSIQYGSSLVAGYMGTEVIGQAQLGVVNIKMITLFTTKEVGMNGMNACGLMGLSNDPSWKNFMEVAATAGQLTDSQFAFQLQNTTNQYVNFYASSSNFPSTITLTWIPVTLSNHWVISISGTIVDGSTYSQPTGLTTGLLDTSTSLVLMGSNAYTALLANTAIASLCSQQNGYVLCPCIASGFPTVFFKTGTHSLAVLPADYMDPLSGSYCMLGFVGIVASDVPFVVLGDVFLKNYFFALDKANNKVGFGGSGVHAE